jgi:RimJ/RimL family protein N-acetyltransferase
MLSRIAPIDLVLENGLAVRLRPLVAEDSSRVDAAYGLLSEESRRNRFWAAPTVLSEDRKTALTSTDEWEHLAWIAIDPEDDLFPGYAGASFWRDPAETDRAEISFTVADAWQRSGLATLLFAVLWHEGWQIGVRRFHGICRHSNVAMRSWWRGVGGSVRTGRHGCELDFDLEAPAGFVHRVSYEMPPSPRRVEAAEWLDRFRELLEPLDR